VLFQQVESCEQYRTPNARLMPLNSGSVDKTMR
jgi:hypothetical protein